MPHPIVFFDVAGPDSGALADFYSSVFDWTPDEDGQVRVPVASPIGGAFRSDPAEQRMYVGVPDVSATLELIESKGGSVEAERFEVPGVVVLGLFRDPAGNAMGLVEMDGELPRVP